MGRHNSQLRVVLQNAAISHGKGPVVAALRVVNEGGGGSKDFQELSHLVPTSLEQLKL